MRRSVYTLFACTVFQGSLSAIGGYNYTPLTDDPAANAPQGTPAAAPVKQPLLSKNMAPIVPEADANLLRWSQGEYPSRVAAALLAGARVEAIDANDPLMRTALHRAALAGSRETLRILIEAGANLETTDSGGRTALLLAAMQGNVDAARLLLQRGARGDAVDVVGNTALHLIAQSKRDDSEMAATILGLCRALAVDARNTMKQTAAQIAVENQLLDLLALLIDQGANIEATDAHGNTLLHQAAGFTALLPFSTSARIVELLIRSNSQAGSLNTFGKTARELAHSTFIKRALEKAEKDQGLRLRRR